MPSRGIAPLRSGWLLLIALIIIWPASAKAEPCAPWSQKTLAQDLGVLENLEFARDGTMLLSLWQQSAIGALRRGGEVETLINEVRAPGGLRVRGGKLYFNTGDSPESGAFDLRDGTIDTYDFATEVRATWAQGLSMPNGLIFLPNGDAVVSRNLGMGTGMTRIRRRDPQSPQYQWARLDDTNGLAIDRTGTWLYTVETFTERQSVYRINIADPAQIKIVVSLGSGGPTGSHTLDDMTIDRNGRLYIASNTSSGQIFRVNPTTGSTCVIAEGLNSPSAVKFGCGHGWPRGRLYVTGFDGTVRELTAPVDSRRARGLCTPR